MLQHPYMSTARTLYENFTTNQYCIEQVKEIPYYADRDRQ